MSGRRREAEPLGTGAAHRRNAVGGRGGGRRPRRASSGGALTTTFTASQGLLLMIPNLYKIAGELLAVHDARERARTGGPGTIDLRRSSGRDGLQGHGLRAALQQFRTGGARFRACRPCGKLPLARSLHPLLRRFPDLPRGVEALGALRRQPPERHRRGGHGRFPRASHDARQADPPRHGPEPGCLFSGTRGREQILPGPAGIVQDDHGPARRRDGRSYRLFDYHGHPEAERVIVAMGSSVETIIETVDWLVAQGEKVGVIAVRLFLPFDVESFLAALPKSVKAIAVLDRTKEPGSIGEPLYLSAVAALAKGRRHSPARPPSCGGRYGLGSKEFTPGMVRAVFEHLALHGAQEPVHGGNNRRRDRDPRSPSTPNSTSDNPGVSAMRVCRTGR